jgi:serine/threonine protein kinase
MRVKHIPCGPAANESELRAFEHLKTRLKSIAGDDEWILLTNLAFSVNHQLQSDEIDIVIIGPPGVRVLEVKHWAASWMESQPQLVEVEADKVTNKAKKIGTTLRKIVTNLPTVDAAFFLTRESAMPKRFAEGTVRGAYFHSFNEWKKAVLFDNPAVLSSYQVNALASVLEPRSRVAIDGSIRRFSGYVNLELLTPAEERFHRIYKGVNPVRQDRVILHLYDLSANDDKNAEKKARREFDTLRMLQQFLWAPRVLDSFQEAPAYPGELFFFTIVDPAAPSLSERAKDQSWSSQERIDFSRKAIRALIQMHGAGIENTPIIHRNITAETILVKHDNTPLLTGFQTAKIPSDVSVASASFGITKAQATVSPEVLRQGLGVADSRSDIYSLCASLAMLFGGWRGSDSERAVEILSKGMSEIPDQRSSLQELDLFFTEMLGESLPKPILPPARFWTEDQIVPFRDHDYRIVTRLGSGGVGSTFKVVEVGRTGEELGTYVAKVIHAGDIGPTILRAYNLTRSHLGRHQGLSAIYEVAKEWRENDFVALMTWIEGAPLSDFVGVLSLLAEDLIEKDMEALCLRWLRDLCDALDTLHSNGLVHGDISPRNIIISGGAAVLTDYDFVSKIGEPVKAPGTILYAAMPNIDRGANASDDFFALAASFFHVVFEKEPFQYGGEFSKERGLNWQGIDQSEYPVLAAFLSRATHPDFAQRFHSASEATNALLTERTDEVSVQELSVTTKSREEKVEWLSWLLQSYPGSRWGNRETRGLDTPFAAQTYVETGLEEMLINAILERKTRLVILCGNAGDGKTALLQHLAGKLGFGEHKSAERVLEHRLNDGLMIRMNLDGSAAWMGKSADDILDEFLAPFQNGAPSEDIAHLLAINDGRLLEWIESVGSRSNEAFLPLSEELEALLQNEEKLGDSHVCLINLNERSLVGGITTDGKHIQTNFLHRIVDRLYGGEDAAKIWAPCLSCSANSRCEVFRAFKIFAPCNIPLMAPYEIRKHARKRLFEALQAVHLRGEVHITARELRAALVYILFGLYSCSDYHGILEVAPLSYWDLAFDPKASERQGEVLKELIRFDPALEAHPQIDRHLLSESVFEDVKAAPSYGPPLSSARRHAFFEWTEDQLYEVARDREALGLARGRHMSLFRSLAFDNSMKDNTEIRNKLCRGISRLTDLPLMALDRSGVAPLRIIPRTPTETAFWVEKPLDNFRIEPDLPRETVGIDRLHRQAWLLYHYRSDAVERLRLGAELFHLLLELSEGYQLGDVSNDDIFANLSIFVRRLAWEDEREMHAWNPMQDEIVFRISAQIEQVGGGVSQKLTLTPLLQGGN